MSTPTATSHTISIDVTNGYAELRCSTVDFYEAHAIAASLPKSYLPKANNVYHAGGHKTGLFQMEANLMSTKNNEVNEAGIKRVRMAVQKLRAAGHTVEYTPRYTNSLPEAAAMELLGL